VADQVDVEDGLTALQFSSVHALAARILSSCSPNRGSLRFGPSKQPLYRLSKLSTDGKQDCSPDLSMTVLHE